jgi:membrane protein implicated in regulation of membrane protease activity
MYRNAGPSMRFQTAGTPSSGLGWMLMVPGLFLIVFAIAILIWPQLLAYLVATVLLVAGISLSMWGWRMFRATRRQQSQQQGVTYYEVT